VAPPVFKTGLAANIVAGGFDSLPPPPIFVSISLTLLGGVPTATLTVSRAQGSRRPSASDGRARSLHGARGLEANRARKSPKPSTRAMLLAPSLALRVPAEKQVERSLAERVKHVGGRAMYGRNPYLEKLSDSNLLGLLLFTFGATVVFFSYQMSSLWLQLFVAIFVAAGEAYLYSSTSLSMRESLRGWFLAHPAIRISVVTHPWLVNGIAILLLLATVALWVVAVAVFRAPIGLLVGMFFYALLSNLTAELFRRLSATSFPVSKTWTD
jgi:hypothetical protein